MEQEFSIEQEEMLDLFKTLFKEYSIDLLLPVLNITDDFEEKNQFLARGIIPKVYESQCLLGIPLKNNKVNKNALKMCINLFNKKYKNLAKNMIKEFIDVDLGEKFI